MALRLKRGARGGWRAPLDCAPAGVSAGMGGAGMNWRGDVACQGVRVSAGGWAWGAGEV
jgi:hypothetical protein